MDTNFREGFEKTATRSADRFTSAKRIGHAIMGKEYTPATFTEKHPTISGFLTMNFGPKKSMSRTLDEVDKTIQDKILKRYSVPKADLLKDYASRQGSKSPHARLANANYFNVKLLDAPSQDFSGLKNRT